MPFLSGHGAVSIIEKYPELKRAFDLVPESDTYVVAYSGGMDSTLLLWLARSLLAEQKKCRLKAIHVNHGLSQHADDWQAHCYHQALAFGVELVTRKCKVHPQGKGIEAAARQTRYRVFQEEMQPGQVLLQGHHLNDLVETVLFRCCKGAAVGGLAGIPQTRRVKLSAGKANDLGSYRIYRPLLGVARSCLLAFANETGLHWLEDESNQSLSFDRNYIRHQVLPVIVQKWPKALRGVSASAQHCRDTEQLAIEVAQEDLQSTALAKVHPITILSGWGCYPLAIERIRSLSRVRQKNLLRYWLRVTGHSFPGKKQFDRIWPEVLQANEGSKSTIVWHGDERGLSEIKKCYGGLYIGRQVAELGKQFDRSVPIELGLVEPGQVNQLPVGNISIYRREMAADLAQKNEMSLVVSAQSVSSQSLSIRFRQYGQKMKLFKRPTKSVKKLLRENRIPYWLRDIVPCVYSSDKLVAVFGVGVVEQYAGKDIVLSWSE
ncbi:MAG: tRNA lysidine(34) synthetase TilS [Gammaproteobacteria bacterium]|nr:MAG: tRNA lysidine(34) synthetase TilS [Gammaproteobacteria bacterium]